MNTVLKVSQYCGWDQSGYKKECIKWVQFLLRRVRFHCPGAPELVRFFLDLKQHFPEEIDIHVRMLLKYIEKKAGICGIMPDFFHLWFYAVEQ